MSKLVAIKLTKASPNSGPFTITDQWGNVIAENVPKSTLIAGISYNVGNDVTMITIESTGGCHLVKHVNVGTIYYSDLAFIKFREIRTACLWRHLVTIELYNNFYGNICPYVIEFPYAYQYHDQIVQNIKSYDKVYKYFADGTGIFNYNDKVEIDNGYFNRCVVYNGQQSSGVLELVPKPRHNMHSYMQYPIFGTDKKTITYTKSDNFYNINTFWDIVRDKTIPLFTTPCESLSSPKAVNQGNMNYGKKSFSKSPIRAKELKVRLELTDRSDIHIVSQLFTHGSQISYK